MTKACDGTLVFMKNLHMNLNDQSGKNHEIWPNIKICEEEP